MGHSSARGGRGPVDLGRAIQSREAVGRLWEQDAVAPGVIETEMSLPIREHAGAVHSRILLRRIGRPEEVAYAVWFLSSKHADYISGQVLHVDGGFMME
jgi:3-oxoacyl-[acyl-carrier protein] reductase